MTLDDALALGVRGFDLAPVLGKQALRDCVVVQGFGALALEYVEPAELAGKLGFEGDQACAQVFESLLWRRRSVVRAPRSASIWRMSSATAFPAWNSADSSLCLTPSMSSSPGRGRARSRRGRSRTPSALCRSGATMSRKGHAWASSSMTPSRRSSFGSR